MRPTVNGGDRTSSTTSGLFLHNKPGNRLTLPPGSALTNEVSRSSSRHVTGPTTASPAISVPGSKVRTTVSPLPHSPSPLHTTNARFSLPLNVSLSSTTNSLQTSSSLGNIAQGLSAHSRVPLAGRRSRPPSSQSSVYPQPATSHLANEKSASPHLPVQIQNQTQTQSLAQSQSGQCGQGAPSPTQLTSNVNPNPYTATPMLGPIANPFASFTISSPVFTVPTSSPTTTSSSSSSSPASSSPPPVASLVSSTSTPTPSSSSPTPTTHPLITRAMPPLRASYPHAHRSAQGKRSTMEDEFIAVDDLLVWSWLFNTPSGDTNGLKGSATSTSSSSSSSTSSSSGSHSSPDFTMRPESISIFAIIDGHGGSSASRFIRHRLVECIIDEISFPQPPPEQIFDMGHNATPSSTSSSTYPSTSTSISTSNRRWSGSGRAGSADSSSSTGQRRGSSLLDPPSLLFSSEYARFGFTERTGPLPLLIYTPDHYTADPASLPSVDSALRHALLRLDREYVGHVFDSRAQRRRSAAAPSPVPLAKDPPSTTESWDPFGLRSHFGMQLPNLPKIPPILDPSVSPPPSTTIVYQGPSDSQGNLKDSGLGIGGTALPARSARHKRSVPQETIHDEDNSPNEIAGAVLTVVLIHARSGRVWVANLGDSRCVLGSLSHDASNSKTGAGDAFRLTGYSSLFSSPSLSSSSASLLSGASANISSKRHSLPSNLPSLLSADTNTVYTTSSNPQLAVPSAPLRFISPAVQAGSLISALGILCNAKSLNLNALLSSASAPPIKLPSSTSTTNHRMIPLNNHHQQQQQQTGSPTTSPSGDDIIDLIRAFKAAASWGDPSLTSLITTALTRDHKATAPKEVERVRKCGGEIHQGRVSGELAVTRAIGDVTFKRIAAVSTTIHSTYNDSTSSTSSSVGPHPPVGISFYGLGLSAFHRGAVASASAQPTSRSLPLTGHSTSSSTSRPSSPSSCVAFSYDFNSPVTASSEVYEHQLSPEDAFLVLACDGVWDVLTGSQAIEIVGRVISAGAASASGQSSITSSNLTPSPSSQSNTPHSRRLSYHDTRSSASCFQPSHQSVSTFSTSSPSNATIGTLTPSNLPEYPSEHVLATAASTLVQSALDAETLDNVSVLVVWLGGIREGASLVRLARMSTLESAGVKFEDYNITQQLPLLQTLAASMAPSPSVPSLAPSLPLPSFSIPRNRVSSATSGRLPDRGALPQNAYLTPSSPPSLLISSTPSFSASSNLNSTTYLPPTNSLTSLLNVPTARPSFPHRSTNKPLTLTSTLSSHASSVTIGPGSNSVGTSNVNTTMIGRKNRMTTGQLGISSHNGTTGHEPLGNDIRHPPSSSSTSVPLSTSAGNTSAPSFSLTSQFLSHPTASLGSSPPSLAPRAAKAGRRATLGGLPPSH